MWEAKLLAGNTFVRRATFADRVDAWDTANEWSVDGETWLTRDGKLDKVFTKDKQNA